MERLNQFALVAQKAYQILIEKSISPIAAWSLASKSMIFTTSADKLCPQQVFVGLCGQGLLQGVSKESGTYNDNFGYAKWVIRCWVKNPSLTNSEVWVQAQIAGKFKKSHNGQVDVVAGLWDKLILSEFS